MLLPLNRRAFLPASMTLGALLCALPALADAPTAPAAGTAKAQTLILQNVVPSDILKSLHWNRGANMPAGVTRISAQPATNSLSVVATPGGFAKVQEIIRLVDIVRRQVQVRFALAKIKTASLDAVGLDLGLVLLPTPKGAQPTFQGYADGVTVSHLLQTLTEQGGVLQSPTMTTTNGVSSAISITGEQLVPNQPDVQSVRFAVTPRVNSDDSITLDLHPSLSRRILGKLNPDGTPATTTQSLQTLRTFRSGDTLVITNAFPAAAGISDSQLLLFVTPTIVSTDKNSVTMTVK